MLGIILKILIYFESDKWIVKCVRIYDSTHVYRTYSSINMMFLVGKIMLILDKIWLSIRRKNYGIIQVQDLISIIRYHTSTKNWLVSYNIIQVQDLIVFFVFSFWNRTKRITRAKHYEYKCLIFLALNNKSINKLRETSQVSYSIIQVLTKVLRGRGLVIG